MDDKLVLTPEQLFVLGTVMGAEHIDYDYIACMHELGRNYQRTHRKCITELAQSGVVRERLSGEITLRPTPERLLKNIFFGNTETILEIYTLGEQAEQQVYRFHWLDSTVTQVQLQKDHLYIAGMDEEEIKALLAQLTNTKEQPEPTDRIRKDSVTRILVAKRATVGVGSTGLVLFEQNGGLYTVDDTAIPTGISGQQASAMLLTVLKGE